MILKYIYRYPTINFDFEGNSRWEIDFEVILPEDVDFVDKPDLFDDNYLLKIKSFRCITNEKEYRSKYPYIRICFQPKVKGKNKWQHIEDRNEKIKIEDLPDLIDCSVNSHQNPKERNWFLYKNCGFAEGDYVKIEWEKWKDYGFCYFLLETTLYYKLVCEILQLEVSNRKLKIQSSGDWAALIKEQIIFDGRYGKLTEKQFEDLSNNFMRDFLYLWSFSE